MGEESTREVTDFDVEAEWKGVEKLLAQKASAAWGMAVVEAHKIFRQTLMEVSFGDDVEEQIHNAAELFSDMTKLMQAHELYLQVRDEINYMPTKDDAQKATDIFLKAILDMTGRDFIVQGVWHRLNNNLNFFWGNHPKFLVYVLSGILGFVATVWILDKSPVGRWFGDLAIGFSEFVVGNEPLLIGLLVAWFIALVLSLVYFRKK
ncbi:MAG: hypothetical protein PHR51_01925 [Patescibacteria group bacterium]|nr:hypothetical protein [Patescibacteria group bacterium]